MASTRRPPSDVDLTGGFRLDLKTGLLLVALGGSWYSQGSKIDSINQRLELQEKARAEVMLAQREAEKARSEVAAAQQRALADALAAQQKSLAESLSKLEAQLKVTSMDVGDLRIQTAKGGK